MAEELGRIEKPEAEHFKEKRKLYLVPLIFQGPDAPPEYVEKFNFYWEQAKEHISRLEVKIGKIKRVYHESVSLGSEEGLKVLEKLNPSSYQIVRDKLESGAEFEIIEDRELVEESVDWERCLFAGLMSEKVARKVSEFYLDASRKRYEHIAKRIDETLKDEEASILFIREGHMVQFPQDIEVFSVVPPMLDEIHRWLRDRSSATKSDETENSGG
jgi:hypothetical protein